MKIYKDWMMIYWETSQECNLRCIFCSIWRMRDKLSKNTYFHYLSKKEIEYICKKLAEFGKENEINQVIY